MTKMTNSDISRLLIQCMFLMKNKELFPKSNSLSYYRQLILYCHNKGWLYCGFDGDHISACAIVFRIKEFNEQILEQLPEKEEGDILFALALVSRSKNKITVTKMYKDCIRENPEAKKFMFYKRYNGKDLRVHKIHRELVDA